MLRRKPIKRRRKARRGPLRDPKYRAWLRRFCCMLRGQDNFRSCDSWQVDPAHTGRVNGMSSKAGDDTCLPLCRKHHAEYDSGRVAFEKKYGVDMKALAKEYWTRYQNEISDDNRHAT